MAARRLARFVAISTVGLAGAGALTARSYGLPEFSSSPCLFSIVRRIDPEQAHRLAVIAAKYGLFYQPSDPRFESLSCEVWGRKFANPIGLAAGFDKNAECIEGMLSAGFGYVEVGSITPEPQPGNSLPRVFRLERDRAVINRYGFNSDGAEAASKNLENFRRNHGWQEPGSPVVLAVNFGKNKTTADAASDYAKGVEKLARFADILVVNVSSPNTPGLRSLQGREQLQELLEAVKSVIPVDTPGGAPPLLVKIAPDLDQAGMEDVAEVVRNVGIDGLIVSNTTIDRPATLKSPSILKKEIGGLSGAPLYDKSTKVLAEMFRLTEGKVPLVGVGGVSNGKQAYGKIRAGASLVQLYSALVYDGPAVVNKIKLELVDCLERDGFSSVEEAIGADHKQ